MPVGKRSTNVRARFTPSRKFEVTNLEARLMMHADPNDPTHHDEVPSDLVINTNLVHANVSVNIGATGGVAVASAPLSSVPVLNSRPAATAKLYLDFNGDTTATWGEFAPGTTPAYDIDGDPTTFSDAELANINEIFTRVAEKYSPFNINVTTVDPGTLTNKVSMKVVFGGDGAWLGLPAGGVAYVGGFNNYASNTVFVFPKNLANGYAKYTAEAAAHESGHAFDLDHQASYDAAGVQTEYAPANAAGDAPIMGSSYSARRGLWWYGTSAESATTYQDDLSVISSTINGFGYRADDWGGTLPTSAALTPNGTTANAAGVIEKTTDLDVFSFTTGAGTVNFNVAPAALGGMLDATLDLRDASGSVVASADAGLSESLSATLAAGTYYITVGSHGAYGDVGQYTLTGGIVLPIVQPPPTPQPTAPAAPSNLAARTLTTTSTRLTWTDNASDETGFRVYGSRDNKTWTLLGTVGANVASADHNGLKRNTTYYYRVRAFNTTGESADSNTATTRTALTSLTAVKGDVNLDGAVNFADLVALSQHYNTSGGMTWADGDLSGDGNVDFADLTLLSQNYNTGTPLSADVPADDSDWGTLTAVTDGLSVRVGLTPTATVTTKTTKVVGNVRASKPVFSVKPIAVKQPAARVVAVRR